MNISTKNLYILSIAVIVIVAGAFYGGMKYSENKVSGATSGSQNFRNFSPNGMQRPQGMPNGQNGANFINGDIIANDEKSITVKLRDGGSKIVFLSESTQITKSTDGTRDDLAVDKNVMINGQQNSDGSVTAQMIQIRPQIQNPPAVDASATVSNQPQQQQPD